MYAAAAGRPAAAPEEDRREADPANQDHAEQDRQPGERAAPGEDQGAAGAEDEDRRELVAGRGNLENTDEQAEQDRALAGACLAGWQFAWHQGASRAEAGEQSGQAAAWRVPGWDCRPEPVQHDRDEQQIEQVVEGLRGEVVLADPVAHAEQERREPLRAPRQAQVTHDQEQWYQAEQVDADRPQPEHGHEVVLADHALDHGYQLEETGPAEVRGDAGRRVARAADELGEPGDLVRGGEPRHGLYDRGHPVAADDQGYDHRAKQRGVWPGEGEREDERERE